jgi:hypothetical protein
MQDDPPQEDNLKAKWEKIYRDVCNDLEEPAQQDECLEIGWQRDAYYSDEKLTAHAEGEFLNDVEDDPDAATMLGTANEFDLDAGLEDDIEDAMHANTNEFDLDAENPSAHVSFGGESDFDIERDAAFFGEEVQSNSYVSSEEESIISAVYPAKQSKIGVVASGFFVAFVSIIASNRRKLILFSLRLLALLLVTWILFVLRG